jgi:hypothetical protein
VAFSFERGTPVHREVVRGRPLFPTLFGNMSKGALSSPGGPVQDPVLTACGVRSGYVSCRVYLAHKNMPPLKCRTLQKTYGLGPMVVLWGGRILVSEVPLDRLQGVPRP